VAVIRLPGMDAERPGAGSEQRLNGG